MNYLVAGLGNPGKQYDNTPHNLGFAVIDALASTRNTGPLTDNKKFLCQSTEADGVLLVKPQTFMNLSGDCVGKLVHFYKLTPAQVFLIHDDVSLALGTLKISVEKGPANHNGVSSIIEALHSEAMPRFRMGIAKSTELPLKDYVLAPFAPQDLALAMGLIDTTVAAVTLALDSTITAAMNQFN